MYVHMKADQFISVLMFSYHQEGRKKNKKNKTDHFERPKDIEDPVK